MARLHDKGSCSAGEVAELAGIAEQFGQRDIGVQHAAAFFERRIKNLATATADVSRQVAKVLAGGVHDHVPDWFRERDARFNLGVAAILLLRQLESVL